jgi:excisionase family DNA binding protein
MGQISGTLPDIFKKFLDEYFAGRVLLDSFDMIFGIMEQEIRKIEVTDDQIAVLETIRTAYNKSVEVLNLRKKNDKELYLHLNIKFSTWERYWQESLNAKKESLYPDFSFNFDLVEKYCKSELLPYRAIEYLRWVYSRLAREYKSNEATEALKLRLLNLIDDLELNLDNRRSRMHDGIKNRKTFSSDVNETYPAGPIYLVNDLAAKYLQISKVTLWRLRKESKIRFTKVGKKVMFSKEDLDEFLKTELLSDRISKTVKKTVKDW